MRSSGKRELVFLIIVFTVFYLLTASVVPYFGIKPDFALTFENVAMNTVKPDIMLALVICCAILSGGRSVVVLGIVFGFIIDVTCSVPVLSPLCYCICSLYAGKISHIFFGRSIINVVLVSMPLLLIRAAVSTFYLLGAWHNISFKDILFGAVIPEYIYNVIAVAVTYLLLALLMKIFRIEKSV